MTLSAIDTNLLLALQALLQEASVTRAARRLGVGQPAMSRSLARLRDHFKDPLLVAKGRQLVLTPGARALMPSVEKAAAAVADVFHEPARSRTEASRVYVVACADLFAIALVPALMRALGQVAGAAAGVEVRPIPARSSEQILDDGADVVLGSFEDVPPTVGQKHLFSDPFVCVVGSDHPQVSSKLSLRTYLALPHVEVVPAPNARPGLRIERALGGRASERVIAARVPYFSLAARLLAETALVLTMTRSFARVLQELAPLKVLPLPFQVPPQRFSLLWHRRHDADRAHARFRDLLSTVCAARFGAAL